MRETYAGNTRIFALADFVSLVPEGQFLVGHIPYQPNHQSALLDCKKVYLYRDIRALIVSFMDFQKWSGRVPPEQWDRSQLPAGPEDLSRWLNFNLLWVFRVIEDVVGWQQDPDTFSMSFELLRGDNGRNLQLQRLTQLAEYLGIEQDPGGLGVILIMHLTRIRLRNPPRISGIWQLVQRPGAALHRTGRDLNANLGYE